MGVAILDRIPRSSLQSARVKATGPDRLEKAVVHKNMKGGRVLDLFKGLNEADGRADCQYFILSHP